MANFGQQMTRTVTAARDMRVNFQYTVQRQAGAGTCDIASHSAASHTLGPVGILQTKPDSGHAATIAYAGISKVVIGAAVTANAVLATNASGRAIDATSGFVIIGRALEAGGADGDIIQCLLQAPTVMVRT